MAKNVNDDSYSSCSYGGKKHDSVWITLTYNTDSDPLEEGLEGISPSSAQVVKTSNEIGVGKHTIKVPFTLAQPASRLQYVFKGLGLGDRKFLTLQLCTVNNIFF